MSILKLLFIDTILDVLYFPLWWYSRGAFLALKWTGGEIVGFENMLGVRIWIKNLWKPMFGQRDWQGKIISFFMRVFQILLRCAALFGVAVFCAILFLIYLISPLAVFYGIIIHLPAL